MVQILVYETPQYRLYVEKSTRNGLESVTFKSVWPQARTDRSPHTLFNINLPAEAMNKIAAVLKVR